MAKAIQFDADGKINFTADGKIIFAEPGDPCCCDEGGEDCDCTGSEPASLTLDFADAKAMLQSAGKYGAVVTDSNDDVTYNRIALCADIVGDADTLEYTNSDMVIGYHAVDEGYVYIQDTEGIRFACVGRTIEIWWGLWDGTTETTGILWQGTKTGGPSGTYTRTGGAATTPTSITLT
jgi:hypothetical protein